MKRVMVEVVGWERGVEARMAVVSRLERSRLEVYVA